MSTSSPEPLNDAVLTTRKLSKRYGKQWVLRDLNLHVPRGSIYGLLGPNGAGKTTVLRILLGLGRPTRGEVRLLGKDPLSSPQVRMHVGGMIDGPAFYPNLTGRENLTLHTRQLGKGKVRVAEVLETVELMDAANRLARDYSLGMRQRLGIALALLGEPDILILDEPQNGLDPAGMRDMRTLLRALQSRGHTLLVSSHLLTEMAQLVTHVGVITGGRLRFEGTLAELRAHGGNLEEIYFNLTSDALKEVAA